MKRRVSILRVAAVGLTMVLLLVGCTQNHLDAPISSDREVRLWGGIDHSSSGSLFAKSRGTTSSTSGIITPTTDEELNIGIARVSKLEDADQFPEFRLLGNPLAATLGTPDPDNSYYRAIEFKHQAQFFPDADNELRYAGWYPWNESDLSTPNVDDDGSVYLSDELKTQVTIDINGAKDVLYGNMIEGTLKTGFPVMQFDHALCLFRIYAYATVGGVEIEGSVSLDTWGELQTLTLQNLPESVVLTLPHQCPEVPPVHQSGDMFTISYIGEQDLNLHDPDNDIYFDAPERLPVGIGDMVLVSKCLVAPPSDNILSVLVKTSLQNNAHDVSIARNFKAGHAYDIILRFSDHGIINADVLVGEWGVSDNDITQDMAAEMYYDLSKYETANSYIVSSANYSYCFDGTIKGNGEGSLIGMSDADCRIDNAGWADIVWSDIPEFDHDNNPATPNELVRIANEHKLSDGKVLFDVLGYVEDDGSTNNKKLPVEGNVLIGVYDKNPQEGGTLIWAWHIWITDKPQGVGCANGYVIMDRNLGATSNIPAVGDHSYTDPAHGLYYQWGRPTPLKVEDLGVSEDVLSLDNIYPDNNPNKIYGSGDEENAWLDHHGIWAENHNHLWGDTSRDHERHEKTLFDPCPPGYFVSNHKFWQGVEQYENTFDANKGVELKFLNNLVWLPMADVLDDTGVHTMGFGGVGLRTATIDYSTPEHKPFYLAYTASKTAKVSSQNSYCNYAYAVRCISTTTTPVIRDLSESQTANCYMITSPGYYKFKANVRGNGVSSMFPYGGTSLLYIDDGMGVNIKPAKVDLLWWQGDFMEVTGDAEDVNRLLHIDIFDGGVPDSDGYITFHIPELHAGNAVLAAYDTDGEILWTWHLWMLRERPDDVDSGRRVLQDRFLGATQAPDIEGETLTFHNHKGEVSDATEALWSTYGFYYQWGRKDPIMGAPVGASADENPSSGVTELQCAPYWVKDYATGVWSMRTTIPRHVRADIIESVHNPLTFYMSMTSAGGKDSQWFTDSFADTKRNVAMWGYAVDDYSVQGQDFTKTMYDPCPPGYRTAFHQVWKIDKGGEFAYGGDDSGDQRYYWTNEDSFSDYGFVTTKTYFDKTFYPYSGMRLGTTGGYESIGTYGYLNTGMPMGQYNTRSFMYTKDGWSGQISNGSNNGGLGPSAHATAHAKPVRCMKE